MGSSKNTDFNISVNRGSHIHARPFPRILQNRSGDNRGDWRTPCTHSLSSRRAGIPKAGDSARLHTAVSVFEGFDFLHFGATKQTLTRRQVSASPTLRQRPIAGGSRRWERSRNKAEEPGLDPAVDMQCLGRDGPHRQHLGRAAWGQGQENALVGTRNLDDYLYGNE